MEALSIFRRRDEDQAPEVEVHRRHSARALDRSARPNAHDAKRAVLGRERYYGQ